MRVIISNKLFYKFSQNPDLAFFPSEPIMAKEEHGLDWQLCKRSLLSTS